MLTGHAGPVKAVAVAPDGSWLASGSWDGTVRIWDVATGQERAVLTGHSRWVGRWRWRRMAAGWPPAAGDGTVRIWDAATGQQRAVLKGHTDRVTAVAVAPMAAGWPPPAMTGGADLGYGHRPAPSHDACRQ